MTPTERDIDEIIRKIRGDDYGPMNYGSYAEAKQAILDWHNKQVKSEPNKCEFGHQLYGHKTAEGWCCACEADQAFWQLEVNKQVEAVLDRLKSEFPDTSNDNNFSPDGAGGWHLPTYKLAIDDFNDAIEAERNKLKETNDE